MASLRDRILGRVRNWNSLANPLNGPSNDPERNFDRIIQSVDKTALARRIRFEGDDYLLELLAGFGRVHDARVKIGSDNHQDFAFEDSDTDAEIDAKAEQLNHALSRLAGQMEGEAPSFEFLNYHFADGGLKASELKLVELDESDVVEAPKAKAASEAKPSTARSAPKATAATGRELVEDFLEQASKYSDQALCFSGIGNDDLEKCNCRFERISPDAFSNISEWQDKVKSELGEDLIMIGISAQSERDCYAFAVSGDDKVGIEFEKRNLAQICRIAVAS